PSPSRARTGNDPRFPAEPDRPHRGGRGARRRRRPCVGLARRGPGRRMRGGGRGGRPRGGPGGRRLRRGPLQRARGARAGRVHGRRGRLLPRRGVPDRRLPRDRLRPDASRRRVLDVLVRGRRGRVDVLQRRRRRARPRRGRRRRLGVRLLGAAVPHPRRSARLRRRRVHHRGRRRDRRRRAHLGPRGRGPRGHRRARRLAAAARPARVNASTGRAPRRGAHPVAWWGWALLLATTASRTANPWLLLLIAAVSGLVVLWCRGDEPWSDAYRVFLLIGATAITVRMAFYVVFGGADGATVLFELPSIRLPEWAAGFRLGGAVSAEGALAAAYDGLRLGTLLVCVGAANALAS